MASEIALALSLRNQKATAQGLRDTSSAVDSIGSAATRAGSVASTALGKLGSIGSAVARSLRTSAVAVGAVGTAATVSLVKTGLAYNDLEQKSKAAFTTILGSEQAAQDMMSSIRDFGRTSPFPRQAFISATQQLLAFGYQAEDVIPLLTRINDATAAVGGNADTIATITDVFAKIKSAGKVGTDDLNRLSMVGINGFEAIAKASGTSIEQVRKNLSDGNVSAEQGLSALTSYMETRFAGASEKVKETWSGAVDRVKGAWRDLGSALVEPFVSTGGGGVAVAWANSLADKLRVAANAAPLLIGLLRTGKTDGPALAGMFGAENAANLTTAVMNIRATVAAIVAEVQTWNVGLGSSTSWTDRLVTATRLVLTSTTWILAGWDKVQAAMSGIDFAGIASGVGALLNGQGSGQLSSSLGSIGQSLQTLGPAFTAFRDSLPSVATLGGLAGDAITILAAGLRILADNSDTLVKLAPYLAAGYVAWAAGSRIVAASVAITNARMILGTGVTLANISANRAHTAALLQNAAAIRGVSVAELQSTMATNTSLLARLRATAATIAQGVATTATTIATRAAAAGQWLLNAALAANPIGLVVVAIAALVAGLVWFFTKTEIGRKAWDGLSAGLAVGWDWLKKAAVAVFDLWMKFSPLGIIITQVKNNWDGITAAIGSFITKIKDAWNWVKKLADRISDSAIGQALGAVTSATSSVFGGARASGGPVVSGRTYLVGEQGPELWQAPGSGSILSNADTVAAVNSAPVNLQRSEMPSPADLATLRGSQRIEIPVVLNGREIARAVYDDAGNQMARS